MAYVKVPKDLTKVKTKVALNLTKRQLIGFTIAGALGIPVYLTLKKALSIDMSMILMSLMVLPILFATLYEKDNLPFEKHLAYVVRFFRSNKVRVYKTRSIYDTRKVDTGKKKVKSNVISNRRKNSEKRLTKKTKSKVKKGSTGVKRKSKRVI